MAGAERRRNQEYARWRHPRISQVRCGKENIMDQKRPLSAVVALLIALGGSAALALDPLGPPLAGPAAGQFQIGADLLYGAVDFELDSKWIDQRFVNGVLQPDQTVSGRSTSEWKNQRTHKVYANLGYGILQNWEVFLRLGGADYLEYMQDNLFTVGGGTKVTFYETGKWSFGGILQLSWTPWEEETDTQTSPTEYSHSLWEYSVVEVQGALGACYRLNSYFSLYGGPFVAFFEGSRDTHSTSVSGPNMAVAESSDDIDVDSWFGGYVGARIQIHENAVASLEYQHIADGDAFAASITYRFGEPR
jgi:hypothetical protein